MTVAEGFETRYEIKQAYSELLLPELCSWVQTHPAGFRTAYPPRQVNSLYFDTAGLDAFNDHIAGVPARRKLRYRWYGRDLRRAQNGQVEVKIKAEQAGWKLIEKLAPDFVFENASWAGIMNEMRSASSGVVRELLAVTRPVVITVYQREYFVSANGRVRLTIDADLKGYDQLLVPRPNILFSHPGDGQVILELKSEVGRAAELADVLSHFPIRAGRYSKYVSNIWKDLV